MNDQDWQTGFISYLTRKERDIDYISKIRDYKDIVDEILTNGPSIPPEVFEQKSKWMSFYNSALKNMNLASKNTNNILIDLIRTDGQSDLELKRLEQLIQENKDGTVTILSDPSSNIDDISELISAYPSTKIVTLPQKDKKHIAKTFISGHYQKFFGMYPSSVSMKHSIEYIKEGIIPIVSSLPDKEPNYIDNISALFDEVLEPIQIKKKEITEIEL